MKNFKEIAEKCLKGELSGTFTCDLNGEIIKVPSKNLLKNINSYELKYPDPHTYDHYDFDGFSMPEGYNRVINFIPDMKQNDKRNIQISLYQAREWYRGSDDTLKTLALSAFSKKELDPYPKSWQDYSNNHPGFLLNLIASESICSKVIAYTKLLLLREEWIHIWSQEQGLEEDWIPDWNKAKYKYVILADRNDYIISVRDFVIAPLSFPTKELAENFRDVVKDLGLLFSAKGLY